MQHGAIEVAEPEMIILQAYKKFVCTTCIVLSLSILPVSMSHAQSSTDIPAAETLLDLMQTENLLERSIEQMLQLQIQQNPAIAPFEHIMNEFLNKHMSYEQLKPELIKIYSDAFTEPEILELVTFYRTPVGEKTIKLMPELMSQGAQMGATLVQENIAELEANIQAEAKRLEEDAGSEEAQTK